jgi:hypothetical protein
MKKKKGSHLWFNFGFGSIQETLIIMHFVFQGMVPNVNIRFAHAARNSKRAKFNRELKSSLHSVLLLRIWKLKSNGESVRRSCQH